MKLDAGRVLAPVIGEGLGFFLCQFLKNGAVDRVESLKFEEKNDIIGLVSAMSLSLVKLSSAHS